MQQRSYARGAGIGAGLFGSTKEAFIGLEALKTVEPDPELVSAYGDAYRRWVEVLKERLARISHRGS